jgi:hypothetical protein
MLNAEIVTKLFELGKRINDLKQIINEFHDKKPLTKRKK